MQQLEYQFSSSFREIIRSAIHFTILFRPQPSAILLPSIMGFWLREKYQNKKDICGKFRCSYNKNKRRAVRLNCDSENFLLHFFSGARNPQIAKFAQHSFPIAYSSLHWQLPPAALPSHLIQGKGGHSSIAFIKCSIVTLNCQYIYCICPCTFKLFFTNLRVTHLKHSLGYFSTVYADLQIPCNFFSDANNRHSSWQCIQFLEFNY